MGDIDSDWCCCFVWFVLDKFNVVELFPCTLRDFDRLFDDFLVALFLCSLCFFDDSITLLFNDGTEMSMVIFGWSKHH